MTTTQNEIREWLQSALVEGATHVIVACDTFDHSDYPINIMVGEDPQKRVREVLAQPMTRIMEVYNLRMDIEPQLREQRAYNL